jgi:origin recognition complex subunit 4
MVQNQLQNLLETRSYLKDKLINDNAKFYGFEKERELIRNLFLKTNNEQFGENALLIGGPKCGKTTLINSVLYSLLSEKEFLENTHIICLDGFYHTDDRLALKTATEQLKLEKMMEGKVFNSFAENFSFLLSCLHSGLMLVYCYF